MVRAAEAAGLKEVGISDHFVLPPGGDVDLSWAMPCSKIGEYVEEVEEAARRSEMTVRLGVEVDYFPETFEEVQTRLASYAFDYVIGAAHFADGFPVDADACYWEELDEAGVDRVYRTYYRRVAELVRTGFFDVVAHLDLPKKFGFRPTVDLSRETDEALDAVAASGPALELNTAGWDKPCAEAYPCETLLRACRRRGVPVLISADAHAPCEVDRHFARGAELLKRVGYAGTVEFAGRRRRVAGL